jgi:hypothetical protein
MNQNPNRLYLVHVGWYDAQPHGGPLGGVFESHSNHFVVAGSPQEAKAKTKKQPWYAEKNCHTDGVQEIISVDGFAIAPVEDAGAKGATVINSYPYNVLNQNQQIGSNT